jgi:hypothetical protein
MSSKLNVFFGNGSHSPTKVGEHVQNDKQEGTKGPAKSAVVKGAGKIAAQQSAVAPKKRKA